MPETCWAVSKRQAINLRNCCFWLVDSFEYPSELQFQEHRWRKLNSYKFNLIIQEITETLKKHKRVYNSYVNDILTIRWRYTVCCIHTIWWFSFSRPSVAGYRQILSGVQRRQWTLVVCGPTGLSVTIPTLQLLDLQNMCEQNYLQLSRAEHVVFYMKGSPVQAPNFYNYYGSSGSWRGSWELDGVGSG
jgi:hypothetical protein